MRTGLVLMRMRGGLVATPNVDRLFGIEPWNPTVNEATNESIMEIKKDLNLVADLTDKVAADIGMLGSTAKAAQKEFASLGRQVRGYAQGLDELVKVRTTVINTARDAQQTSRDLQKKLKEVNEAYKIVEGTSASSGPGGGAVLAQAQAIRDAKHAKLDAKASEVLAASRQATLEAISQLPFQPADVPPSTRHNPDGGHDSSGGHDPAGGMPIGTSGPESGSGTGLGDTGAENVSGSVGPASGVPRSATDWSAAGTGSAGHAGTGVLGSSNVALQASHYAPHGAVGSGGAWRPSVLDSPSVHNPLATAAAMAGGTAVAGYKAYQAVRAARLARSVPTSSRAATQSGAARRTPASSGRGILRGATTAVRTPMAGKITTAGRSVTPRGGATGIARPASAGAGRSSGILKGTTTASRARVDTPSTRSSGILKGTTTASRARVATPSTRSSGILKGTTTASRARINEANQTARTTNRSAVSSTRTTVNRPSSSARSIGTGTRGASSSTRSVGSSRTARGVSPAGRAVTTRGALSGSSRAQTAAAVNGQSRTGGPKDPATSRALSNLTGTRRTRKQDNKDEDKHSFQPERSATSAYEPDRKITFLPAGHTHQTHTSKPDTR